ELVVDPEEAKELSVNLSETSGDAIAAPGSAIRVSLVIAWCCIIAAALSVAGVLQGVVTLSERRGAFVSTVTHELRTPLTTFRMYSDMLSAGMIEDEEKKGQYLETLRIEADRLSHLVENVLQYARLERGKRGKQRQAIEVQQLWQRIESRLADRADQAGMQIKVDLDPSCVAAKVLTDPAAVEQILFNLVDNACKYAGQDSLNEIEICGRAVDRYLRIRISDQGPGIPADKIRYLFRPFSKSVHDPANTAPGVGLGLALCRQLARALGGELEYDATCPAGASFLLSLPWASADRPVAGSG
ncbi:MAG: HAMP domain-containing sensor histidine kinase, partial [Planctomycetota bacterium]|nr:HAMP domain-containing sensor histidine kinase [Planctomycetota bacterium]